MTKHGHKGPATRRQQLASIPLMYLSAAEFEQVFEDLARKSSTDILEMARIAPNPDLLVAGAVLRLPSGAEAVVIEDFEYGDGEGVRFIDSEVRSFRKLLKPGESVRRECWKVRWSQIISPKGKHDT